MTINEMKQSYKQSYTDNVDARFLTAGMNTASRATPWGPGVARPLPDPSGGGGQGRVYQVNGASHTLQEGDLFLAKPNQLITPTPPTRPTRGSTTGSASTARAPTSWCSRRRSPTRTRYTTARTRRPCGRRCTTSTCPAGRSPSARP